MVMIWYIPHVLSKEVRTYVPITESPDYRFVTDSPAVVVNSGVAYGVIYTAIGVSATVSLVSLIGMAYQTRSKHNLLI